MAARSATRCQLTGPHRPFKCRVIDGCLDQDPGQLARSFLKTSGRHFDVCPAAGETRLVVTFGLLVLALFVLTFLFLIPVSPFVLLVQEKIDGVG